MTMTTTENKQEVEEMAEKLTSYLWKESGMEALTRERIEQELVYGIYISDEEFTEKMNVALNQYMANLGETGK